MCACVTEKERERERVQQTGYRASLITLEVGSRGLPNMDGFRRLKQELKLTTSQLTDLMVKAAR